MINDNLNLILHQMDLEVRGLIAPTKDAMLIKVQVVHVEYPFGHDKIEKILEEQYAWVATYDKRVYWYRFSSNTAKAKFKKRISIYDSSCLTRIITPEGEEFEILNSNTDYFTVRKQR